MSNTKHLADLLKVCSILPALAIMPAMADENKNIVVENEPMTFENMVIDYETTDNTDALGVNATGATQVDFNGDITNIAVNAEGNPEYSAAVFNRNSKGTVLNFNTDKTILSATGSSNSVLGVRVNGNGSVVNLNGETEINVSSDSTAMLRAIDVTDGGYVSLNDDTVLNLTGGKDVAGTIGILSSGAKSVDLAQGKDLEINASGVHEIYGLYAQYGGAINMAQDTEVDIHSTATDGDAHGVISGYATNAAGIIDSKGEIDIDVSGNNAYGLMNFGGASTHIADLDIVAKAKQIARGIWVTDDKLDGSKAETTDVVIGSKGSKTEIIAKGADTKNTAGIWVEQLEKDVELTVIGDVDIESDGVGVKVVGGAVANIGTEGAKEIKIDVVDGEAVYAYNNGTVNIGSADTESVKISSDTNNAVYTAYNGGLPNKEKSITNITGKEIEISTGATGWGAIHVASNVPDIDYANSATVNITGDSIKILAPTDIDSNGIGIAAMSRGIINVVGDTTISAEKAIAARGEAKVNINTSGEHTVKMLGDIVFDYDKETSGTSIDAYIDVTLAGAESFWTGNTVVSYGSGKPEDESLLAVSNAKLTVKDGAVWNATKITDSKEDVNGHYYTPLNDLVINGGTVNIADTKRGITVDRIVANDAVFNGGMLNVNETIDIKSGTTVFNSAVLGDGVLTLAEGATLDIGTSTVDLAQLNINGTVLASVLSDRSYGTLTGTINAGENGKVHLNVGSVGTYKIFGNAADINVTAGDAYIVKNNGADGVVIETKAIEDIAADAGISTAAAGAIAGLANAENSKAHQVSLALQQILNSDNAVLVEQETAKLNPTDKPVAQAAAASVQNQVLSLVSGRMGGGMAVGRAGGDEIPQENGFWMQGLFNKSKLAGEFHGYTRGIALGADTLIDRKWTIGGGLALNNSDVHADAGHTDIDSKTLFLYGQYKPAQWFVNGTLTYNMSEYTEDRNIGVVAWQNEYDVDAYGAQVMGGYDFASGVTTKAGLRYLHVAQDGYTDGFGLSKVADSDTDFLTGVAGVNYAFVIENDWDLKLRPELSAALTYDFVSDEAQSTVTMPGTAAYVVNGERLSRLGGEFGIGLTALYKGMEVSLMYDLVMHKDYTSQTGMIKFRGRF